MAAGRGRALASAVRVVHRIHRGAARLRPDALVAIAPRLADRDVLMLGVADRADGGAAVGGDHAHLARGEAQRGALALLRDQLDGGAGGAAHLPAAARLKLDVVDRRAGRDEAQRQRVADGDVGALAGLHPHAHAQAVGREDVALLAVGVVDERDVRGAVGVVLDRGHAAGNAVLGALEVDAPVEALGAAAAVARGDPAVRVAAARLREALGEVALRRLLGELGVVGPGGEATSRRRWLVALDGHPLLAPYVLALEE